MGIPLMGIIMLRKMKKKLCEQKGSMGKTETVGTRYSISR